MAPRADLTGQQVAGWEILRKAPAQARVRFWTTTHEPCGIVVDLPHVTLTKALAGKGTLPACTACVPAEDRRNISHGMHLVCGQAHLIGTPCPADPSCSIVEGRHVIEPSVWDQFEVVEESAPLPYSGHPADALPESAYQQSIKAAAEAVAEMPADPPAVFVLDTSTATFGRVDRLEEPQAILDVIRRAIIYTPRSQQDALGPSELGGCERKLGHRLALGKSERDPDGAWRPQVGTAVHAWLADVFTAAGFSGGRWLSDYKVTAPVAGTLDLFDVEAGRVIDFKLSGPTVRAKAAKGEISDRYETQLDLYGLGMVVAGHRVESVALLFLPPAGSLSESVWYSRPFDPARAVAATERHAKVAKALLARPFEDVLAELSTSEDYCQGCGALGKYCQGAENAWIPGGLPDSAWPAYDAALKALGATS